MKLIILSFYKCLILYYILLCFVMSVIKCLNVDETYDERTMYKEDFRSLFQENAGWKQGDIPLLNKKIFKGVRVTIREHPYVASVRRHIMHYSVATMLTRNLFITVAHPLIDRLHTIPALATPGCSLNIQGPPTLPVEQTPGGRIRRVQTKPAVPLCVPFDEIGVVVGENYADRGATLLTVMLIIIHEYFDRYTLASDLALLRVYEDTPFRCSVKAIQLVHPYKSLAGHRAFVTGWGRCDRTGRELCLPRSGKYTPGEKFDPMLRSVSFLIEEPNLYCEGYKRNGVIMQRGMLCTGRSREEDKVGSCLAVPGAPLVVDGHLAGMQSWGYGCGYEHDLPLVYTSMQHYQPWLLHNIPLIRRIYKENLTILFEAKRAYILAKWLNITRAIQPEQFMRSDRPMEILKLDKELVKLRGHIIDIRDYLFDGIHHKYKMKLYVKLRQKIFHKDFWKKEKLMYVTPRLIPFLNHNTTEETKMEEEEEKLFKDASDTSEKESDKSYEEYE